MHRTPTTNHQQPPSASQAGAAAAVADDDVAEAETERVWGEEGERERVDTGGER